MFTVRPSGALVKFRRGKYAGPPGIAEKYAGGTPAGQVRIRIIGARTKWWVGGATDPTDQLQGTVCHPSIMSLQTQSVQLVVFRH